MKYSKKTTKIMCNAISKGMTLERAWSYAGISRQTYYNWKKKGEDGVEPYVDFLEALKKAESDCIIANLKNISKAAKENGAWQASAWILERRFPKEYGRNQETGNDEAAKKIADAIKELSE